MENKDVLRTGLCKSWNLSLERGAEVALQNCFSTILAIPPLQYRTPFVPPSIAQPLGEEQEGIHTLPSTQDKPSEYYYHSSQVLLIL